MANHTPKVVKIPLSKQGKNRGKYEAVVDAIDSDLAQINWRVLIVLNTQYAARNIWENGKYKCVELLHREIMKKILGQPIPDNMQIDHIDGDGLNNRRSNLRLATPGQNQRNVGRRVDNKSGYKGVYWHKAAQKWRAEITVNGKKKHLGLFDTTELAYQAYCEAADELHGEFANYGE